MTVASDERSGCDEESRDRLNYTRDARGKSLTIDMVAWDEVRDKLADGPVYRHHYDCLVAQPTSNHFRFRRDVTGDVDVERNEYNAVGFDEDNLIFHWRPDPLNWWPTLDHFSACYARLAVAGSDESVLFSSSTRKVRTDELVGVRDVVVAPGGGSACVEYQCSYVIDKRLKRNLVTFTAVTAASSRRCLRRQVSPEFEEIVARRRPVAKHATKWSYRMFAPYARGVTDHEEGGWFMMTRGSPLAAKRDALRACMRHDDVSAVAVTFEC